MRKAVPILIIVGLLIIGSFLVPPIDDMVPNLFFVIVALLLVGAVILLFYFLDWITSRKNDKK